MDPFGRLYSPDAIFQRISILDNSGNRIARIGTYGNVDDLNDELAGKAGTAGRCTMAYPMGVDATDDFIYVTDAANYTLLRIQKTFVLDNFPEWATRTAGAPKRNGELSLVCSPNPFAPQSRVRVSLPRAARLTLDVLDVSGRLVARLAQGTFSSGAKSFVWNGKRSDGSRAAAGLYFFRLVTGRESRTIRAILAR
jgi:hypothetical protein